MFPILILFPGLCRVNRYKQNRGKTTSVTDLNKPGDRIKASEWEKGGSNPEIDIGAKDSEEWMK